MLRIEAYPALGGLIVRVVHVGASFLPGPEDTSPTAVTRTIPVETVEQLGAGEAIRDCVTDILVLYPGLVEGALH